MRTLKNIISIIFLSTLMIIGGKYTSYILNNSPLPYQPLQIITTMSYLLIILIACTRLFTIKIIEIFKKNNIQITIVCITILTIIFTFTPKLIFNLLDKTNYNIKNNTLHGTAYKTSEKDLYTYEKAKNLFVKTLNYQDNAKNGNYKKIFDKTKITNVYISIDKDNFNYLLQNAELKPKVLINSIKIGDYKINYASIKTKGMTTLNELIPTQNDRFSFTIDFDEYINKDNNYEEKQNLLGLKKISFNNMLGDPTMMKEYLSYYLLTEMGIPTPEYGLTNLYINNRFYGVYFMIEPIDDALIERTLKEKNETDFLFKIENNGGSLLYNKKLDKYLDENNNFNFDSILYDDKGNIQYPYNNDLTEYNGIWENDEKKFKKIAKFLPKFFKTIKKLNELSEMENKNTPEYEIELNKLLDSDSLAKYWAANVYLVNSDSYISRQKVNYVIYMNKTGKFTIIPWDYNLSFGGHFFKRTEDVINHNIQNPTIETTLHESPLLNVILGNNNLYQTYKNYLNDATIIATFGGKTSQNKTYQQNNFINIINHYQDDIIKQQKYDIQSFYNPKEIKIAQENLKLLTTQRSTAVKNQINNNFDWLTTNIDYDSLGSLKSVVEGKYNKEKIYN